MQLSDIDLTDMDRFQDSVPARVVHVPAARGAGVVPPADRHRGQRATASGSSRSTKTSSRCRATGRRSRRRSRPSAEAGGIMIPDIGPEVGVGTMMLMMDPPQHTRYRKIVSSAFTPRVIQLVRGAGQAPASAEIVDTGDRPRRVRLRHRHRRRAPAPGDRRDPRRAAGRPREAVRLVEQDGRQLRPRVPRDAPTRR